MRKGFNGLGSFMLDGCAHEVSRLNRRLLRLDCGAENMTLCAYYESLGFVRVGLQTDGIAWSLYEKPASSVRR